MNARLLHRAFLASLGVFLAAFFAILLLVLIVSPCFGACVRAAPDTDGSPPARNAPDNASQEPASDTPVTSGSPSTPLPIPPPTRTPFVYSFNSTGVLSETSQSDKSTSPYWFLDSGGELLTDGGIGQTVHGVRTFFDRWRIAYARNNPRDSDEGFHPQNIFRLVTRHSWEDADVSLFFRIDGDNLSPSEYRNASNGLLLMTRYRDHNTLYYFGIRVDGTAVIKKKYAGIYYTMAQIPIFPGVYDRKLSPNLLPHGVWLGLKASTVENADGSVTASLSLSQPEIPGWTPILSVTDDGVRYGGTPPITGAGLVGVRTDFMDVSFKDFRVTPL